MENCQSSDPLIEARDSPSPCKTVHEVPKVCTQEEGLSIAHPSDQEACKDITVGGEVVVTANPGTSISEVISTSLQAVNGDCDTELSGPVEELDVGTVGEAEEICVLADSSACCGPHSESCEPHKDYSVGNKELSSSTHEQECPDSLSPSYEDFVTGAAGVSKDITSSDSVPCSKEAENRWRDLVHRNTQSSEVNSNAVTYLIGLLYMNVTCTCFYIRTLCI